MDLQTEPHYWPMLNNLESIDYLITDHEWPTAVCVTTIKTIKNVVQQKSPKMTFRYMHSSGWKLHTEEATKSSTIKTGKLNCKLNSTVWTDKAVQSAVYEQSRSTFEPLSICRHPNRRNEKMSSYLKWQCRLPLIPYWQTPPQGW
jgi:hypothetical protein